MPGLSIIMPAHNESAVIERTLKSILANPLNVPLQIIVVANGCTDDTAQKARALNSPSVQVIETEIGNKPQALNLGDAAAQYFPRAFMDADVELSPTLLQNVVDAFNNNSATRIAAPGVRHLYKGHNPFLAGYYHLWRSLPYVQRDTMARGFFAIDQTLRQRFDQFPALTADDKFIRNLSKPEERMVVGGCYTTVYMPATFKDLLRVKTRWTYGNLELAAARPDLNTNDQNQHQGALQFILKRPWHWPNLPAFVFVYYYAHREARRRFQQKQSHWERADSSRAPNQRPS